MVHTHHPQDADDLFGDTLATALDPKYAGWDRAQYATAAAFLGSVMNGLARNRVRSSYMARRAELDEQNPPPVSAPTDDPEGKLLMAGKERKREDMEAMLRTRVADKPIPLAVLAWAAKGIKCNQALAAQMHRAMARATCQWLDAQGQLWPLYQGWRDSFATDHDGIATFTRVTGRAPTAPEADADWRAWVLRTH
jgi:hypothetical protein